MNDELDLLKSELRIVNDLNAAVAVLNWDQETHMPPKGGNARARQLGTIQRIAHEKFISEEMGERIEKLHEKIDELPPDSDDAALVRLARRQYLRARQVPPDRMAAFYEHAAKTWAVWTKARENDDFDMIAPNLEKTLEFSQEIAGYFPEGDHIADSLIDFSDYGMKVADIKQVFSELRKDLVPLVAEIGAAQQVENGFLYRHFPEDQQRKLGLQAAAEFGYDPLRCRQDKAHHPFMTKFSINDVRITTRFDENYFSDGFFSTVHETGHALYELGINEAYEGLPLASGTSSGVHESQSRLWENIVGRSREFWSYFYPYAREAFPGQLSDISLDGFYAAINRVERSLIRTEADEVTYNLHVMIRFDLEMAMLEGNLSIRDLPDAWRDRYQSDMGVSSPTDANGVLQDVHWYAGIIGGAFQGYTLGNIMACQFYEKALDTHPEIPDEISKGEFSTLQNWLKANIYQYGSKYDPTDLLVRVTGRRLDTAPLIKHLREKFGAIYGLDR